MAKMPHILHSGYSGRFNKAGIHQTKAACEHHIPERCSKADIEFRVLHYVTIWPCHQYGADILKTDGFPDVASVPSTVEDLLKSKFAIAEPFYELIQPGRSHIMRMVLENRNGSFIFHDPCKRVTVADIYHHAWRLCALIEKRTPNSRDTSVNQKRTWKCSFHSLHPYKT